MYVCMYVCYNALCQLQIKLLPRQTNQSEMRLLSGYGDLCTQSLFTVT